MRIHDFRFGMILEFFSTNNTGLITVKDNSI